MTGTMSEFADAVPARDRRRVIGPSEVAALFDAHPFLTRFELWHRKAGTVTAPDISGNPRVQAGVYLEPAVARWAAEQEGWSIRKASFVAHPTVDRFGGTPDYLISDDGVMEVKVTDWRVARGWPDGEPPLAYQLQLQAYLALTGRAWGALVVLVGGNDLRVFRYDARPRTIARLEEAVGQFWADMAAGNAPAPDFHADADAVLALHREAEAGKTLDMTGDNYATELCARYVTAKTAADEADTEAKAARAELLDKIGDASRATCGPYTINAGMVKGRAGKTITADMIGQTIGASGGYRKLAITHKEETA